MAAVVGPSLPNKSDEAIDQPAAVSNVHEMKVEAEIIAEVRKLLNYINQM